MRTGRHDSTLRRAVVRQSALVCLLTVGFAAGCGNANAALEQLSKAQATSEDLLFQFDKAAAAGDRAVMAASDELSASYARDAKSSLDAVERDSASLGDLLANLKYQDEIHRLTDFNAKFAAYRPLEEQILALAVENTNLKAQRLSYGAAQAAADEFASALNAAASGATGGSRWQARALAAEAVADVRQIQAWHASHIAEPDDSSMTRMENRMADAHAAARRALTDLAGVGGVSRGPLATATAALDRFMAINAEIISLSRRNTNVRSLALTLDQKRKLVGPCEESARALHDALAHRGYPAGR